MKKRKKIWFYLFWISFFLNVAGGIFLTFTSGVENLSNIASGQVTRETSLEDNQREDDRFNDEIISSDLNKFERWWTHKCFRVNNTLKDFLSVAEEARRDKDYPLAYEYLDLAGAPFYYWDISCMEEAKNNIFPTFG